MRLSHVQPHNISDQRLGVPKNHPASRAELEDYGYTYAVLEEQRKKKRLPAPDPRVELLERLSEIRVQRMMERGRRRD